MADPLSAVQEPTPRSADEIREWLIGWMADRTGCARSEIDTSRPLDAYGLDSQEAAQLSGELEDWVKVRLSPTLPYEYPTIAEISTHLGGNQEATAQRPVPDAAAEVVEQGGENFDLRQLLFAGERLSVSQRVARFAEVLATLPAAHRHAYRRVVASAADREVQIVDPITGTPRTMLMFGSNNYLGLGNHPRVRSAVKSAIDRYGVGVGGPPLLNGHTRLHEELERRLSASKHAEATLVFASGYGANLGLVSALADGRGDTVIYDEYSHASFVDGVRLAGARRLPFRHNDVAALEAALAAQEGPGDVLVGVEGVYSMDGDLAPLDRIVPLCRRYRALLVLDDAHGTGVLGPDGSGTAAHFGVQGQIDLTVGTFSKAFGVAGGFVSGPRDWIEYLRFFARSYMFSASLPPVVVAAVLAGLDVLADEPERLTQLRENVAYTAAGLARVGLEVEPAAAIIALRVPSGMDVRRAALRCHQAGLFVNPVEYPAVPRGQERLRISLMATHTRSDIDRLVAGLEEVWWESGRDR